MKNIHLGDLFYNTVTGYCYRWQIKNNEYSWNRITDVDVTKALSDAANAQSTANNKRRVFVSTPVPPYDIGDLWAQGTSGDLMRCLTAKTKNQTYTASDWVKASKYTDDTKANAAQSDANALKVRMSSAETTISKNSEEILLKASKTEVEDSINSINIGGRNYILNSDKWVLNGGVSSGITQSIENGIKKIVATQGNGNWNSFNRDNTIESNFKTGDEFVFAIEIKSEDGTKPPSIYFKSGLGYYPMKGTVSNEYSWCYYTGTWKDTNDISFHFGWNNAIGTYYIRRIMFIKGNKLLDWSLAPEDIDNNIATSSEAAKNEAISSAASDATTKANNALANAKTYTDSKIKIESDRITSAVTRIGNNESSISTLQQTATGFEARLTTLDTNLTNNYTTKTLKDTRSTNEQPTWYMTNYPRQIVTEFKNCSAIGLSGVGTYCTLQTTIPWTDKSGGFPKQTAKVDTTGKEFWRVGKSETEWSNWIDPYGLATTANTNASNAAKTATNYLGFSSAGLVVGDMTATTLGKNVLIDSDSVDIRNGTTTLASFGANTIYLGRNSSKSVINLCSGSATMTAVNDVDFKIYTDKRLVMSAYSTMLLDCWRDATHMTRLSLQSSDPNDTTQWGSVSLRVQQDSVVNTFIISNNTAEFKITDGTNTSRIHLDEEIFRVYAANRIRLNSVNTIQIAEASTYKAGITLGNSYGVAKSINLYWADGSVHDFASNSKDGLTSYFGPGDISKNTVTLIRGKTVRLYAHSGGGVYLGVSGSTAITSDKNMKKDILDIDDKYMAFFDNLRPITYKYNSGHRDHIGFIAQEVESALNDGGLTSEQFAGLVIENDVTLNNNYDSSLSEEENAANGTHYDTLYSLRYEEFIALLVKKVQNLQKQINEMKGE